MQQSDHIKTYNVASLEMYAAID